MTDNELVRLRMRLEVSQQDAAALGCLLADVLEAVDDIRVYINHVAQDDTPAPSHCELATKIGQWGTTLSSLFERIADHPALMRLEQTEEELTEEDDGPGAAP